jgi:hypothetical protein
MSIMQGQEYFNKITSSKNKHSCATLVDDAHFKNQTKSHDCQKSKTEREI